MTEPNRPTGEKPGDEPDPLEVLAAGEIPKPRLEWRISKRAAGRAAVVAGLAAGLATWILPDSRPWWIPPFRAVVTAVLAYRLLRPVWRAAGLEDEI